MLNTQKPCQSWTLMCWEPGSKGLCHKYLICSARPYMEHLMVMVMVLLALTPETGCNSWPPRLCHCCL